MPWLIDGSNLLGAMRADRHSDFAKRELVRCLAAFARARNARVTCVFDGHEPPSFARHLGAVTVAFSGRRAADDLIAERAAHGRGWSLVTSDRALIARVVRRGVEPVTAADFIRQLEQASAGESSTEADWIAYFSDPENREKF